MAFANKRVSSLNTDSSFFSSDDGTKLHVHTWKETRELEAVIYAVHDLSLNMSCYSGLFKDLAKEGVRTHAIDLRGHGRSLMLNRTMIQGDIGDGAHCKRDLTAFLRRDADCGVPRFLFGHGFGGLLVLAYALDGARASGLAGVIAIAPALKMLREPSRLKTKIHSLMSRIFPKLTCETMTPQEISRDPKAVHDYESDPSITLSVPMSACAAIAEEMERVRLLNDPVIPIPLLIAHGTNDKVSSMEVAQLFFDRIECSDKTFKTYEGGYHGCKHSPFLHTDVVALVHVDICKDQVTQDLADWILEKSEKII